MNDRLIIIPDKAAMKKYIKDLHVVENAISPQRPNPHTQYILERVAFFMNDIQSMRVSDFLSIRPSRYVRENWQCWS